MNFNAYPVGKEIYLISKTFNSGAQGIQEFRLAKFIVNQQADETPFQLPIIEPISPSSSFRTRIMRIKGMMGSMSGNMGSNMGDGMHTINDKTYDLNRIDEIVDAGGTEIWVFDNSDAMKFIVCIFMEYTFKSLSEQVAEVL